ncbi:unnamed protein product, partial [Discosporangium mesarthrocarpum]
GERAQPGGGGSSSLPQPPLGSLTLSSGAQGEGGKEGVSLSSSSSLMSMPSQPFVGGQTLDFWLTNTEKEVVVLAPYSDLPLLVAPKAAEPPPPAPVAPGSNTGNRANRSSDGRWGSEATNGMDSGGTGWSDSVGGGNDEGGHEGDQRKADRALRLCGPPLALGAGDSIRLGLSLLPGGRTGPLPAKKVALGEAVAFRGVVTFALHSEGGQGWGGTPGG